MNETQGDIVRGLTPETRGHWLIKTINTNEDGSITIKFLDYHDDEPFWWSGTIEQYNKEFIDELNYKN